MARLPPSLHYTSKTPRLCRGYKTPGRGLSRGYKTPGRGELSVLCTQERMAWGARKNGFAYKTSFLSSEGR